MPITIYPGTVKKRNLNGTYSDLVPGADANPQLANDIAEEYDPVAGVYGVGDYCIYQSVFYKCITAISTPEAFDSTKWTDISVAEELTSQRNTLNQLGNDIAIILQDPAQATFLKGTYVVYNNQLYTVNSGGIPMGEAASEYYPSKLTAVSNGGLNYLLEGLFSNIGTPSGVSGKTNLQTGARWQRIGDIVGIKCIVEVKENLAAGDIIVTNIPPALNANQAGFRGYNPAVVSGIDLMIWHDGTIRTVNAINKDHTIRISYAYLC